MPGQRLHIRQRYYLPERFRDLQPDRVPIREADPHTRTASDAEVLGAFDPLEAIAEAQRCLYCHEAPCLAACPIGQDCREYILELSRGNFEAAKAIVTRDNPFASSLSRVCFHYCEAACTVGVRGQPVAVRHLKRAALDFGGRDAPYVRGPPRGHSVGIVGGGPAGLLAAWHLAQRGFDVVVYEASAQLGGLVTMTIPTYRLPRSVFQEDIHRMRDLGIEFRFGVRLGDGVTVDSLRAEHDAVLLAIGTHIPQVPRLPGRELPGVHDAIGFLKGIFVEARTAVGARVAVIGGGDVAMDCARMALRRGAKEVALVYRRSREEMPASEEEARECEDEGVEFLFLTAPLRVVGTERAEGLECQKMSLGPPDAGGRRKPIPVEGTNFVRAFDTIVLATGQGADLAGLEGLGAAADPEGVLVGLDGGPRTRLEDVFVAGGTSVVAAMRAGREAATEIERYLEQDEERQDAEAASPAKT